MVAYDNRNRTTTVPIVREDGSVQINTVISSPDAPTAYPYQVDIPDGTVIEETAGSVLFVKGSALIGGLAPAWARDADGRSVPTHYVVDGTTITQIVDHGAGYTYPIVADPWMGSRLFEQFWINRNGQYRGKNVYSGRLSPWGWSVYSGVAQGGGVAGVAAGYLIIRNYGWDEWKDRIVGLRPAATLEQQYVCHARFGYAVWKAGVHWDLEVWRSSFPDWTRDPLSHKCNWDW